MEKADLYIYRLFTVLLVGFAVLGGPVEAATKKALDKKINSYLSEGLVIGGRAGQAYSLLKVRRDYSKSLGMERVILDIGDHEGRPLRGQVSYFQASVETQPPRLVLDLSQLSRSAVSEAKLKQIFTHSPYVKKVELTSDPEDRSASLILALRRPMDVEVFEMPSKDKASRIVIDFKEKPAKGVRHP